jgi:hypothetical protein
MQVSFDALALQLVSSDFSPVLYCELYCQKDGGWRCAVTECDEMMPCPRCGTPRAATVIAEGYTRHPGKWERWAAPLSTTARASLMVAEVDEAVKVRREQKRGQERSHHYATGIKIDPKDFTWESSYA